MEIIGGELKRNDTNQNAMGGTELMAINLHKRLNEQYPGLLKDFQIIFSRIRSPLAEDKIRLFYCHDLPNDPESQFLKDKSEHDKFHKFIFVSNWQMQQYIQAFGLPWSKCIVLKNAIDPIEKHEKPGDKINLVYFSTPHRGLQILVPVFEKLAIARSDVELHVYSSFNLYGWSQRDEPYEQLFKKCREHERIHYHAGVTNEQIREDLKKMHILAYPSIWPETSCLVLMEAMSAGLLCVHSNYAALFETAGDMTLMYQLHESMNVHADIFYNILNSACSRYDSTFSKFLRVTGKDYADSHYSWDNRLVSWAGFLESLLMTIEDRGLPKKESSGEIFMYKTS